MMKAKSRSTGLNVRSLGCTTMSPSCPSPSAPSRRNEGGFSLATDFYTTQLPTIFVVLRAGLSASCAQGREAAPRLAARGFLNELGKPYAAKSVASIPRIDGYQ